MPVLVLRKEMRMLLLLHVVVPEEGEEVGYSQEISCRSVVLVFVYSKGFRRLVVMFNVMMSDHEGTYR